MSVVVFEPLRDTRHHAARSETGYRKGAYTQGGKALSTILGGQPNPEYVEWLMGVPERWTDFDCSETASSLRSRNASDAPSSMRSVA